MKRPIIKDVNVRRYVEHLESKLRDLDSESIKAQSYKSLRKFVTNNNRLLHDADVSFDEANNKDDKYMDRAFKYADKIGDYITMLDKMYAQLGESYVEEIDREAATVYEKALNSK